MIHIVRAATDGFYAWSDPDAESILRLRSLCTGAPFNGTSATKLHCTLIYSHLGVPSFEEFLANLGEDPTFKCLIKEIAFWPDTTPTNGYLVATLASPQLQDFHKLLSDMGLKHSFEEYTPHITIGSDVELTPEVESWIDQQNSLLRDSPIAITLEGVKLDSVK